MTALITLTDNANRILADRMVSAEAKRKAVSALMAIDWAADLTRAVGSGRINRLLQEMRNEHFPMEEYEPPRDMLIYAAGENPPYCIRNGWYGGN